jgi:hypothetical protein
MFYRETGKDMMFSKHRRRRCHLAWALAALAMLVFPSPGSSYDIYADEYQNTNLPGSKEDKRGLPNSPFDVVSNRLSDGMSSRSILTTTSPAFPRYKGILVDPDLRKRHYNVIKESEQFQGGLVSMAMGWLL